MSSMTRGLIFAGIVGLCLGTFGGGRALAHPFQDLPVSALCMEVDSGLVLAEEHADLIRPPASMLKMMQMLMVAEGLEAGSWTLETPIAVSGRAASRRGTSVNLKEGEVWPLGHLMLGVAVSSANDASTAVAEGLWGNEAAYLAAKNRRARELGMLDTKFNTVHGLPPEDGVSFDRTTARDMALLARACVRHPLVMDWASRKELQFRPGEPPKYSTNKLLWRMPESDGLKTGFIRAAGFCIAATAERDGVRLISVVMGNPSKYGRFNQAQQLLEDGFSEIRRFAVIQQGQGAGEPVPVLNSDVDEIQLEAALDIPITVRASDLHYLDIVTEAPVYLDPPIAAGTVLGEVRVELAGEVLGRSPLRAPRDIALRGWRLRVRDGVARWEGLDTARAEGRIYEEY